MVTYHPCVHFDHMTLSRNPKEVFTLLQIPMSTAEYPIGKITYQVCSSVSEKAKDTLDKKIKKLIRKDVERNAGN